MNTLSNDWDEDEREALRPFQDELQRLQERHENDPPLDVLRAATGSALPDDLQTSTVAHLEDNRWSRVLVEGANAASGELDSDDEARLLDRVYSQRPSTTWRRFFRPYLWPSLLAAGAVAVVVVAVVQRSRESAITPSASVATDTPGTASPPPAARPLQLPLDKPDVKISPRALTYRGDVAADDFLSQLKPALDAYRQGDYQRADREFTVLSGRYPKAVEVLFYQGIARLLLNDFAAADASLSAADRLADESFAADIAWYRAVVDERLGRVTDARKRLTALCGQDNQARQRAACEAARKLR